MLSQLEREKLLSDVLDKDKVVLTCGIHKRSYGDKRPPVFKCKQCQMVQLLGLFVNTPKEKHLELLEALEHMTAEIIQADKEGRIDRLKLYNHPKITIQREDGRVYEYNKDRN
jgi:hypothetical protein